MIRLWSDRACVRAFRALVITMLAGTHTGDSLPALELPEFAQARGPGLGLRANKRMRAVLDLPLRERTQPRPGHAGKSGARPCAAPAVLVGEIGKRLVRNLRWNLWWANFGGLKSLKNKFENFGGKFRVKFRVKLRAKFRASLRGVSGEVSGEFSGQISEQISGEADEKCGEVGEGSWRSMPPEQSQTKPLRER